MRPTIELRARRFGALALTTRFAIERRPRQPHSRQPLDDALDSVTRNLLTASAAISCTPGEQPALSYELRAASAG